MINGKLSTILGEVGDELTQATSNHGPLNSAHEAYAVIMEEVCEFWDEVKLKHNLRSKDRMREELIQIAAMAVRTIIDVVDQHD
jgi:hypothetical protein